MTPEFAWETDKNYEIGQDSWAATWTQDLPNTKQVWYPIDRDFW
jgi:hypothetical protein